MKKTRPILLGLAVGLVLGLAAGAAPFLFRADSKGPARRYINLPNRAVTAPFSDGVLVGETLYLAGRLGLDKDGKIPNDVEQEARLMIDGIKSVLAEAGMTMDDLVSVQLFCSDVSLFDKFNPIYRSYFKEKELPARAFLGSGTLLRGAHFEIQAVAVKR